MKPRDDIDSLRLAAETLTQRAADEERTASAHTREGERLRREAQHKYREWLEAQKR